jgi:hypothetical protein
MGCLDNKPPYTCEIYCTGKGTHRYVEFRPIFSKGRDIATDAELLGDHKGPRLEGPDRWKLHGQWREGSRGFTHELKPSYRFKCKYCGRDTQLTAAKLVEILDPVNDAGWYRVDISQLPY